LNQSRYYHELQNEHSLKLPLLKSFFLHRLKFWAMIAFLSVDHFPRFHLNQSRYCWEMKGSSSGVEEL
jgi:hypothetical protein